MKKLCQIGKFPNLWDQLDKRLGLSKEAVSDNKI